MVEPLDPAEPDPDVGALEPDGEDDPPCDEDDDWLDGNVDVGELAPPLDDGCGIEELLPPPELDELLDEEDDGEGMELGIVDELVVLQPATVAATATISSVDKPWVRFIW